MTDEPTAADPFADPAFRDVADEVLSIVDGDSSGHDADHLRRVFQLCMRIAGEVEREVDREVLGTAVLVHDVHRAMGDDGEHVPPEASLAEVRAILDRADFPERKVPEVLHCVAVHDEYDYRGDPDRAETVEAEILQDADNLDAMGAVGIARTFAFTGVYGNPLWNPEESDEPSGLGHVHAKLLRLDDEMNTDAARAMAADRHHYLEEFAERFEREWRGES